MRILIFGAGVLGCNLAYDFWSSGKDTTLLARGNWADVLRENGLRIKKKFTPFTKKADIPIITSLKPDDIYDVIFVVIRYSQLENIIGTLRENRSENIVFVGNNVNAEKLADSLPDKNVMFAFSSSAGYREADRVCSVDLRKITIGQTSKSKPNDKLIGKIFESTGFKVNYEPCMEDFLLCHAAYVLPIVFACYRTDGDLKKLRKDENYQKSIVEANIEAYRAIERAGHTILPAADKNYESDSYRKLCLRFLKLLCSTCLGKLCASDHAMNAVDEMSLLNRDLKARIFGNDLPENWKKLEADAQKYLS